MGNAYNDKGDYDKALYYEKCLAFELATLGDNHQETARTYMTMGLAYNDKG